jgi:hypothetical protein
MNRGNVLRFSAGAGSALLLAAAGIFLWTGRAQQGPAAAPAAPAATGGATAGTDSASPATPPSADERTREQRRFDRVDRDRNGQITLEEINYPRRRAFQRLDVNNDGQLSFDEWAIRTTQKFNQADANHDRVLTRAEFATTAPHRRTPARQARCNCAQPAPPREPADDGEGN